MYMENVYFEQWFEERRDNPSDYNLFYDTYHALSQEYVMELVPLDVFKGTTVCQQLVALLYATHRTPFCCFDSTVSGVLGYSHMTRDDFLFEINNNHTYTSNRGEQLQGSELLERIVSRYGHDFIYVPVPYVEPSIPSQMNEQFFAQMVSVDAKVIHEMHDIVSSTPMAYALADRLHRLFLQLFADTWSYITTPQKVAWLRQILYGYRVPLYTVSTYHRPVAYLGSSTLDQWVLRIESSVDIFEEMTTAPMTKGNQGLRVDVAFDAVTPEYARSLFTQHALNAYNGHVLAQMHTQCFMHDTVLRERLDDVLVHGVTCSFDSAVTV